MWRHLRIPNVFTMEASFCGPKPTVPKLNYHFNSQDLANIGKTLCQSLLVYQSSQEANQIREVQKYHQSKEEKEQQPPIIQNAKRGIKTQKTSSLHRGSSLGPPQTRSTTKSNFPVAAETIANENKSMSDTSEHGVIGAITENSFCGNSSTAVEKESN